MKWKKASKLSTVLWIVSIVFIFAYPPLFMKDGIVDSNDRIVFIFALIIMAYVGVVSSINLTSDSGKKITVKSVIGAILFLIIFTLYRMTIQL
ncbi:hypothetical protein [Alkalihalobacillus sp. R86527]|uniref:hypothetical protein n=1 Tax=Alkalihalobacillus sp. R86527 TaxID=3093863 RepID=UPI00366E20C7